MIKLASLFVLLTLCTAVTAAEKLANNLHYHTMPGEWSPRSASCPPQLEALEEEEEVALRPTRSAPARIDYYYLASSLPTTIKTRRSRFHSSTSSVSGYGSDNDSDMSDDVDNDDEGYFMNPLYQNQHGDFSPPPIITDTPEVIAARAACLAAFHQLEILHAPTMITKYLIEDIHTLPELNFVKTELEEFFTNRQNARSAKTKPVKCVTFPKGPVSTDFTEKKVDLGIEDYNHEFQNRVERLWAGAYANAVEEKRLAAQTALEAFYATDTSLVVPQHLADIAAGVVTKDHSLEVEEYQELIDGLKTLTIAKV